MRERAPVFGWAGRAVGALPLGDACGECARQFRHWAFRRVPDASKCAFAHFAGIMFDNGLPWIDCQTYTDHLARFGAKDIPRAEYLEMLAGETINKNSAGALHGLNFCYNMRTTINCSQGGK